MPGFDGKGPMGGDPVTGGARGYCNSGYAGYGRPAGYGRGLGYGRGYGAGRGFRRGYARMGAFYAPAVASGYAPAPADELNDLKQQADSIKNTLDAISSRIAGIENSQ